MRAPEEKIVVDGPVGKIDVIMERPDAPRGIALIAHPHPIGGGAYTNKVQAEAFLRWCVENDRNNSRHWIRMLITEPHEA